MMENIDGRRLACTHRVFLRSCTSYPASLATSSRQLSPKQFKADYRFDSIVPMSTAETIWNRVKDHPLRRIGPGLITGVADHDPSGIAGRRDACSMRDPLER
jgi:hypothetical protein